MEVHQLRTLRELRDRGSVTAVAQALHLSPSAVSQQLASLQRTVAVPLTEQRGRVLALTAAGERVAAAADEVIAALARADQAASDYLVDGTDAVTVTAFHSAGLAWFPTLIEKSLAEPGGPDVRVRDEDVSTEDFVGLAADYDLVVAHRPFGSSPWPTDRVHAIELLDEPIDLAMSRTHRLASQRSVRLADLAGETWLAAHEGFPLEPVLVQAVSANAGRPIDITHRVNEFGVASAIVARTDTVCLLPRHTGLAERFRDHVVLRPVDDLKIGRHISLLSRRDAVARTSIRVVASWIAEIARASE